MLKPEMLSDADTVCIQFGYNTVWRLDDAGNPCGWVRACEYLLRDVPFERIESEFRVSIPIDRGLAKAAQQKATELARRILAVCPGFSAKHDRVGRGLQMFYGNEFLFPDFKDDVLSAERAGAECQEALRVMEATDDPN